MLTTLLLTLIMVTSISYQKNSIILSRVVLVSFLYAAILVLNTYSFEAFSTGLTTYNGLLQVDGITSFFELLILIGASLVFYSFYYTKSVEDTQVILNYSYLVLFSIIGSIVLVSSTNFITLFLAIELQSFAVYVLSGLYKGSHSAVSASLKYFLIGALSSTLILLGSALIYGNTGLIYFNDILYLNGLDQDPILVLGGLFVLVGLVTKMAVAPFHYWAPDVYDGVPTAVTLFLSNLPKLSIISLLIELMLTVENQYFDMFIITVASASLIVGSVLGLRQSKLKRLLTYSTISHLAYIIIPLSYLSYTNLNSLLFYIAQYTLTNINIFLIVIAMGYVVTQSSAKDVNYISELTMIVRSNSALALAFALCLFSFSGIPPLAGFWAKYYVLTGVMEQQLYFFSLLAIITSVISAIYYLNLIKTSFASVPSESQLSDSHHVESTVQVNKVVSPISYTIGVLTNFITSIYFIPQLLLKSVKLVALSQFLL